MLGQIHSLESFGTVDGPGIRFVIFMQGCPLRCLYCHNPDTWEIMKNAKYNLTPRQLLDEVLKYKNFIKKGGVTVTGGEPLLQAEFLSEFFKLCHQHDIHTALDTSGVIWSDSVSKLIDNTDLVLLDIKAFEKHLHKRLTKADLNKTLLFLDKIAEKKKPTYLRHVIVPTITDNESQWRELAAYLKSYDNIEKIELLPYHTMGTNKYETIGLEYPLKGLPGLEADVLQKARDVFREFSGKLVN